MTTQMNLASLKRSRGARKTILNKLFIKIRDDIANQDVFAVDVGLAQLLAKEMDLMTILGQIEALTDPNDLDAEIDSNEALRDSIIFEKMSANRFLADAKAAQAQQAQAALQVQRLAVKHPNTTKLPKLELKKFEGTWQDWERFADQFTAGVDKNANLSAVEKFNYLRTFLSPEAEKAVQGLKLTDANYAIAWDILKNKYGKVEVLIDEHIYSLLHIQKVSMSRNGSDLRRFLEEFTQHYRSLESLGTDLATMGAILCPCNFAVDTSKYPDNLEPFAQ